RQVGRRREAEVEIEVRFEVRQHRAVQRPDSTVATFDHDVHLPRANPAAHFAAQSDPRRRAGHRVREARRRTMREENRGALQSPAILELFERTGVVSRRVQAAPERRANEGATIAHGYSSRRLRAQEKAPARRTSSAPMMPTAAGAPRRSARMPAKRLPSGSRPW